MFYFHILDLNVNEWVPVKGFIYWGYGHMDPVGLILLLLRPWMCYNYIVIQVVCWVELPEQRRLCPIFVKIWILINETQQCGIGSPEIHRNSVG